MALIQKKGGRARRLIGTGVLLAGSLGAGHAAAFRFSPPDWQTLICLPDDPCKTLVNKDGELLYGYGGGGGEFDTRVSLEVSEDAVWQGQELLSPRVPVVLTRRTAEGLEWVEETFALTETDPVPRLAPGTLRRLDEGGFSRYAACPKPGIDPSVGDAAVQVFDGTIRYAVGGGPYRIGLALCEGWWDESGRRRMRLSVEGAPDRCVDTVADIGKNRAGLFWFDAADRNGDGVILIEAVPSIDRNAILNGIWIYPPGDRTEDGKVLAGETGPRLIARMADAQPYYIPRGDAVLVRLRNTSDTTRTVRPRLRLITTRPVRIEGGRVTVGGSATVTVSRPVSGTVEKRRARHTVELEPFQLEAGACTQLFLLYGDGRLAERFAEPGRLLACRERAVAFWNSAALPYGRIRVPDSRVQALLDASVRTIWQTREVRKGVPVFQPGPTCYRGVWVADGAFLAEAATLLGAAGPARQGIDYLLTHQKAHGGIQIVEDFHKENGIMLWACCRHARLTRDREWLRSVWPRLERVAERIRALRALTLETDTPLDDGLMPPGMPDGGQRDVLPEYSNALWNLTGLRAFAEAARWLGQTACAEAWQAELDAGLRAFRQAAARDLRRDAAGNRYLPNYRGDAASRDLPQRAQWAFCQAVCPGGLFARGDPLVAGQLAMLAATERQGMVVGTGWHEGGVWSYFASLYGHAWLWQGDGRKAAELLVAFAEHASPLLSWCEEHSLAGERHKKIGDMPHAWACAEFIRLAIHLVAMDRGDELHLLEGFPKAWAAPGCVTRLDGIATPFGPLTLGVSVSGDGGEACVTVEPMAGNACARIIVHRDTWAENSSGPVLLDPRRAHRLVVPTGRARRQNPE